jgi:hypothetical protein
MSRSFGRSGRRRGAGQALTEFALVVPFFLLVLYGIIEFGRYVYTVQVLNNAAREGARYAIVHGEESNCPSGPIEGGGSWCDAPGDKVKAAIQKASPGIINSLSYPSQSCPTAGFDGAPDNPCWPEFNKRGKSVTVRVETTFTLLLPIPIPAITVEGSSTLVVNH